MLTHQSVEETGLDIPGEESQRRMAAARRDRAEVVAHACQPLWVIDGLLAPDVKPARPCVVAIWADRTSPRRQGAGAGALG